MFFAALIAAQRGVYLFKSTHELIVAGKDREIAALLQSKASELALKDEEIKRLNEERELERARGDKYEDYYWRLNESLRDTVSIVANAATTKRGER
jgi:hypothetical protein